MSRRIIIPGLKDENGIYIPKESAKSPESEKPVDLSIASLKKRGLMVIERIIRAAQLEAGAEKGPSRSSVQNLRDCMAMLDELEKQEKEILEDMTDEQLKELATKGD